MTPISDAVSRYQNVRYRLHMPGHKGALGISAERDVTELPGLDNLHNPAGCIMEAQALLAEAFGAFRSFFLVNGSSAGILAFLLSLGRNKQVLLERGAHKSFANGLALAGHGARFLPQRYYDGIPLPSVPGDVKAMLARERFDAVCLVSPNYYGLCARIGEIGAICKAAGTPLFIDEAHGAHFAAGAPFPKGAAGHASAWVQSAHKTLPALTQGAYLHIAREMDAGRIQSALSLVQTTSPSYLLLQSLDEARAAFSPEEWRETAERCDAFRNAANALSGIRVCGEELAGFARDPARVVIDVSARCTGFEAARKLLEYGIAVEMADFKRLVLIVTPYDAEDWPEALLEALGGLPEPRGNRRGGLWPSAASINRRIYHGRPKAAPTVRINRRTPKMRALPAEPPQAVLSVRDAVLGESESIPLEAAAGRVSAAAIGLYPPGTPLIWPGERISENVIQYLLCLSRLGGEIFGLSEGLVRVVENE